MFAFIRDSYGCIWYEFRIIEFKDEFGETNKLIRENKSAVRPHPSLTFKSLLLRHVNIEWRLLIIGIFSPNFSFHTKMHQTAFFV